MTMQQITHALEHIGPLSALELSLQLVLSRLAVNKQVKQLREKKRVYITRFERQPDGVQGRCTPVYALGEKNDAKPLDRNHRREVSQRYYARHSAVISTRRYSKRRTALGVWAGLA